MKIMLIFGTRPEAIKMCPLVNEIRNHDELECVVCLTGQHKEMLQQVMDAFSICEDYNLDIMKKQQTLTTITSSIIEKLDVIIDKERPDIVLVHGDTTTSFSAALAAFYHKVPVGHVEAGLRTYNIYSPYPEEMNRQLTGRLATYHFAPTANNKMNLAKENIVDNVYVTGNTVIDAFKTTVKSNYIFHNEVLNLLDYQNKKVILITAHRRENLGTPLTNICMAIKKLAERYHDVEFVYPVHLNPNVRECVYKILDNIGNIKLIEPLDVIDMHNLIARCYFVMTDSGGLQEEAPSFGKPVLVLRTETERPEAVEAGTVKVVGVNENDIYKAASILVNNEEEYLKMAKATNPYGDGQSSKRIVDILIKEMRND